MYSIKVVGHWMPLAGPGLHFCVCFKCLPLALLKRAMSITVVLANHTLHLWLSYEEHTVSSWAKDNSSLDILSSLNSIPILHHYTANGLTLQSVCWGEDVRAVCKKHHTMHVCNKMEPMHFKCKGYSEWFLWKHTTAVLSWASVKETRGPAVCTEEHRMLFVCTNCSTYMWEIQQTYFMTPQTITL